MDKDFPLVNGKPMNKTQKFLWSMILFCENKGERWSIPGICKRGYSSRMTDAMCALRDAGLINVGGDNGEHVLYSATR
jgi:hypothetical protein